MLYVRVFIGFLILGVRLALFLVEAGGNGAIEIQSGPKHVFQPNQQVFLNVSLQTLSVTVYSQLLRSSVLSHFQKI